MVGTDFSTRIDVQQPSPALLPVAGDIVSEYFSAGLSSYRSRLERSLGQSSSAVTLRQRTPVQLPRGRQQQVSSATAGKTSSSSKRIAANSRRPVSQPAPLTRRRPPPSATASTAVKPALRPAPASDRPFSPTSRTGPTDYDSPAHDETATSSTAEVTTDKVTFDKAIYAETVTQRTESAEGSPPVDLQLFTVAEVIAQPLLAGSDLLEDGGLLGSSSQSDEGPEVETLLEPRNHSNNDILIPPVGLFAVPNLVDVDVDAVTNRSGEAAVATDDIGLGDILQDDSQTNGLSVTVSDSQSGRAESTTDAQVSQQTSSNPNPVVIPIRQVQAEIPKQLSAATGSRPDQTATDLGLDEVSSVDDTSDQAAGTNRADFRSVRPIDPTADDSGTTALDEPSTATLGSADSSVTAVPGEGVDSTTTRRRGDDGSTAETQTTGTASTYEDNRSGPTPLTGQANPMVAAVDSPLIFGVPSAVEAESAVTGSQPTEVVKSTTDSRGAPPVASGSVTTSLRGTGPAQTTNGPQGGQVAELVDRVATALRSAHQSQRELRIRLTPPELGTVRIEVSTRGGILTARLEVETTAAQQAIQNNLSLLRDALAQHGTNLERIDIHLAPSRNEEGQPQSGEQRQPDAQQQERQEHQQSRQGSQESQRSEDEEDFDRADSSHSLDELDIQV